MLKDRFLPKGYITVGLALGKVETGSRLMLSGEPPCSQSSLPDLTSSPTHPALSYVLMC